MTKKEVLMSWKHKLLIAVDGSRQALAAVRYISRVVTPEDKHVTLFHILPDLPEPFLDLNLSGAGSEDLFIIDEWRKEQKRFSEEKLEAAHQVLLNAGFVSNQVQSVVGVKQVGVARDILAESHKGYNAVVIGRTGKSALPGLSIGGVANKLMGAMYHLPLIIVGGEPDPSKLLLAFDGSSGSENCVDFVGALLGDTEKEVLLCHVIRPLDLQQTGADFFKPSYAKEWIEANRRRIVPALTEAKDDLVNAGMSASRIGFEILAESLSRAGALVQEAKSRNFGTIVVGRRGLTIVNEFLIGRVSTKVVNLAGDRVVWVVN
jgi:nucleotide-binding universal stress UspA family protein